MYVQVFTLLLTRSRECLAQCRRVSKILDGWMGGRINEIYVVCLGFVLLQRDTGKWKRKVSYSFSMLVMFPHVLALEQSFSGGFSKSEAPGHPSGSLGTRTENHTFTGIL